MDERQVALWNNMTPQEILKIEENTTNNDDKEWEKFKKGINFYNEIKTELIKVGLLPTREQEILANKEFKDIILENSEIKLIPRFYTKEEGEIATKIADEKIGKWVTEYIKKYKQKFGKEPKFINNITHKEYINMLEAIIINNRRGIKCQY